MKRIYRAYFVCFCGIILSGITPNATASGEPKLSEKWKTTKELDVPECVILNSSENMLYVSNVAGKPAEKNGAGFISKVSLEGKIEKLNPSFSNTHFKRTNIDYFQCFYQGQLL